MSAITPDDRIKRAAAQDAGDRNMRAHGRTTWNHDDWNVAAATLAKLTHTMEHTHMNTYTPGPWRVAERKPMDDYLPIVDAEGSYIAMADFPDLANHADDVAANALLIAAAPDLAEVVKQIFQLDLTADLVTRKSLFSTFKQISQNARAALIKAGL